VQACSAACSAHLCPAELCPRELQQQAWQVLVEAAVRDEALAIAREEERVVGAVSDQQRPGPAGVLLQHKLGSAALHHGDAVVAVRARRLGVAKHRRVALPAVAQAAWNRADRAGLQHPRQQQQAHAGGASHRMLTEAKQHHQGVVQQARVGCSVHRKVQSLHVSIYGCPQLSQVGVLARLA